MVLQGGDKGWSHQPIWADADTYMAELEAEQELATLDAEQQKAAAEKAVSAAGAAPGEAADPAMDPMEALEQQAVGS
ncbi:peptidyl-prolyl cis-trans isomerase E [Haematococcus lacustris]|uniref:Peptidyl-prolyl cis-trans isomerase E n=1 Tax=Haematococcus lacustris TaxID=44745 RepID=A0A6A0A4J2_HAELA|nr:peptidyl-prolyl cis-trans isomerase E [Haematococcus lacustris]